MDYPEVRYHATERLADLELDGWDGTRRRVSFRDEALATRAKSAGRAELDCSAIAKGFLPSGATSVSRAIAAPSLAGAAEEIAAAVSRRVEATHRITPEGDEAARLLDPVESRLYYRLVRSAFEWIELDSPG